uniref:DDE Tnp4 domain-containing protein n=1 Tax=Cacopsylla melanoneura TaxID=428564 RepID=A0A8D8M060_9HEMI
MSIEEALFLHVIGKEALCILLRRLAYPNRWTDLEPIFGLSAPYMSKIGNIVLDIIYEEKGRLLLQDLRNLHWLTEERLQRYAQVIGQVCPLHNCWGFIDGTARPIARPSVNQEAHYSGHKRVHCLKYQGVACPDGLIVSMMGPFEGARHDAGVLRDTNLMQQLEEKAKFSQENKFVLYGDPAYPMSELLLKPFATRNITQLEQDFNTRMATARQAVEWGFGKVIAEFAFLDFKKNQKILWQQVGKMYLVGTLLTNCHTCLYGGQTSIYFNIDPISIEEYLLE